MSEHKLIGKKYNNYTVKKFIDKGGNGEVFIVSKDGKEYAMKMLFFNRNLRFEKKYARFKREIKIVKKKSNEGFDKIIPIIHSHTPSSPNKNNRPYYIMELAKPFNTEIDVLNLKTKQIIKIFLELSNILVELHSEGIVHRDIKPNNILYYNDKPVFCDYGLVDYPNAKVISDPKEGIGAYYYMAPEFRRNGGEACGKKGDVYSLAKTLWACISGNYTAFDGQYNPLTDKLNINQFRKNELLGILHTLIKESTSYNPDERPDIDTFKDALEAFLDCSAREKQNFEWTFIQDTLFNFHIPATTCWEDRGSIVDLINQFSKYQNFNHTFFNSGGLDLKSAEIDIEEGFILLYFGQGSPYKCKPKKLWLETFPESSWNYLYLELEDFEVNGIDDKYPFSQLKVWEESIGKYLEGYHAHYGRNMHLKSAPALSKTGRSLYLLKNEQLLICSKFGRYNEIHSTYDGYHKYFTPFEFRNGIEELIKTEDIPLSWSQKVEEDSGFLELNSKINCAIEKDINSLIRSIELDKNSFFPSDNNIYGLEIHFKNYQIKLANNEFSVYKIPSIKEQFKNTRFHNLKKHDYEDIKYGSISFQSLSLICDSFNQKLKELKIEEIPSFDIKITNYKKPTYLFTKDDIKNVLLNGQHQLDNQLVIDIEGHVKLRYRHSKEWKNNLFAVYCNESFPGWCNTTGKYTDISLERIDTLYNLLLNYWLEYLSIKEVVRYVEWLEEDNDILIDKITKILN